MPQHNISTPHAQLTPKHWKALQMIEEGMLSFAEIAKIVGWKKGHLYALYEGNTSETGGVGDLFYTEVQKISERNSKRIRDFTKDCKTLALRKMQEFLREHEGQKADAALMREVTKIMNTLAKSTPNVEIGSFSYTRGLSAEDLVNEFRRLKGLAAVGNRIRGAAEDGTREIPGSEEPGSSS
jgi:hypothetical protein